MAKAKLIDPIKSLHGSLASDHRYYLRTLHGKTFYRWLKRDQEVLQGMGVSIRAKILPLPAVRYICEKYNMHPPDWFVFSNDIYYICKIKCVPALVINW